MSKILTGQLRTVPGVYYAVAQASRVVSMVALAREPVRTTYAVSEPIANPFRVLVVSVKVLWFIYTGVPAGQFRVTTGVGTLVDAANVRGWDSIIPLRFTNTDVPWDVNDVIYEYDWNLRKPFSGQGRRLGLWFEVAGSVDSASCYVSFQIEEG